jgi:uncharacterized coiled-coil protein SlyX
MSLTDDVTILFERWRQHEERIVQLEERAQIQDDAVDAVAARVLKKWGEGW